MAEPTPLTSGWSKNTNYAYLFTLIDLPSSSRNARQFKMLPKYCKPILYNGKFVILYTLISVTSIVFVTQITLVLFQGDWTLSVLNLLASLLEDIDLSSKDSRPKLPELPPGNTATPWTFTPHNAQYITYLISHLLGNKVVDVRSRNLIHKVILRMFRVSNGPQVYHYSQA